MVAISFYVIKYESRYLINIPERRVEQRMPVVGCKITKTISTLFKIIPFGKKIFVLHSVVFPQSLDIRIIDISIGTDMRAREHIAVIIYMKVIVRLRADKTLHNIVKKERIGFSILKITLDPQP